MSERKVPMFAEHGLLEETLTGWSYSGHNGLDTDSLSDRLVNPDEYEPLIPAVNQQAAGNFQFAAEARVSPLNSYGTAGDWYCK